MTLVLLISWGSVSEYCSCGMDVFLCWYVLTTLVRQTCVYMCMFSILLSDDGKARPGVLPSAFIHTWLDHFDLDNMQHSRLATRCHTSLLFSFNKILLWHTCLQLRLSTDTLVEVRSAELLYLSILHVVYSLGSHGHSLHVGHTDQFWIFCSAWLVW